MGPRGAPQWSVGVHTSAKPAVSRNGPVSACTDFTAVPPGSLADPRLILGEVRDCIVVMDAAAPATVWTRDGLYAGAFTDGRMDDGLPDYYYQDLFYDDNQCGQVLEAPDKTVIWGAMSADGTPFYRVHGWENWQRQEGPVKLAAPPQAAQWKGDGLAAEYFAGPDLKGKAELSRVDPGLWFGPMWGDHHQAKAKNRWFDKDPPAALAAGDWSARWSGFLEAPVTEDFVLTVYTYGTSHGHLAGSKVRLFVDGQLVIDEWNLPPDTGHARTRAATSKPLTLHAGRLVPVRLEYSNVGGDDTHLHLYWQSASMDLRHVPTALLYSKATK